MRNLQMWIVSAVKICKQRLQTASAFPRLPAGASPLDPTGGLPSPDPVVMPPTKKNIPDDATDCETVYVFAS